jgi:hypothetical protein
MDDMSEMKTYYYFEACGYVSEPFHAADLDAAEAHVAVAFRDPADPDFDDDDGGIIGLDGDWWECLATFIGDTGHNPDNAARLDDAIHALTGPTAPTPGGP